MEALAAKYEPYAERTPPGPLMRSPSSAPTAGGADAAARRRDHSLHEPG